MNRIETVVDSFSLRDSYAWLKAGRNRLAANLWTGIRRKQKVVVRILSEDVMLCGEHPGRVSARNVLPGHVTGIHYDPAGARVTVDVGFRLTARVTRRTVRDLNLRRGAAVYALVKATAIVPESIVRPRFRVTLIGPRGEIEPRKIDFLKAVDQTGSLTLAAKEMGIAYRSAWLWTRAINRAWDTHLLVRTRGGRGGGGAVLTPEGRALVRAAAELEQR